MKKKKSTPIIVFIILMMFQSCSCGNNQPTQIVTGKKPVIKIDSTKIETKQRWMKYYAKVHVKESGMHYVIYTSRSGNDFQIVNISKDSLECEAYRRILVPRNNE